MIDSDETIMYEDGRDAGYLEGYEDGLQNKIETINPHSTEAIVLFYNMNTSDEQLSNMIETLHNNFPNNKVITLPDNVSLESCSKDVLENIISMISEIIDQL